MPAWVKKSDAAPHGIWILLAILLLFVCAGCSTTPDPTEPPETTTNDGPTTAMVPVADVIDLHDPRMQQLLLSAVAFEYAMPPEAVGPARIVYKGLPGKDLSLTEITGVDLVWTLHHAQFFTTTMSLDKDEVMRIIRRQMALRDAADQGTIRS